MKSGGSLLMSVLLAAALLLISGKSSAAAVGPLGVRVVAVTLNAGETYVITDLGADNTPAVHIIDNPQALIVHTDRKGQIVLLAAAAGEWAFDIKNADGQPMTYRIKVKAIVAGSTLSADAAPAPSGSSAPATDASKAVVIATALDAGAGPVTAS
ncbi:MAG: hypothetical protein ACREQD_15435, partial [Candidatus Binataceae bacterium]